MFVGWGKKFGKTCNFATLGVVDCDADFSQGESGDQVFTCGEALPHLSLQGCPSYRVQDDVHDDMIMYVPYLTLHGCSSYSYKQ